MTPEEYTELIGFLDRKFEELHRHFAFLIEQAGEERRVVTEHTDNRFDMMDRRFDKIGDLDRMDGRLDRRSAP